MPDKWLEWILSFELPNDINIYKMNGRIIYTLSGYGIVETNYVYLSDLKDYYVRGLRLDELKTEEEVHRGLANVVLGIQVDLKSPKSYTTYKYGGKQMIIAP